MELLLIPIVFIGGALFIWYSENERTKEKREEELEYEERMKAARDAMRPPTLTQLKPVEPVWPRKMASRREEIPHELVEEARKPSRKKSSYIRAERRNDDYYHEGSSGSDAMSSFAAGLAGAAIGNALFGDHSEDAGESSVSTGSEYSGGGSSGGWTEDGSGDSWNNSDEGSWRDSGSSWSDSGSSDSDSSWGSDWSSDGGFDSGFGGGDW